MPATVTGVDQVLAALAAAEDQVTDRQVNKAAADLVLAAASPKSPVAGGALKASGKSTSTNKIGMVRFGGPRIPWAGPEIFGSPAPRKQGGFNRPNPFPFEAGDERRDDVIDIYLRNTERVLSDHLT